MTDLHIIKNNKKSYKYIYHVSDIHIENKNNRYDAHKFAYKKLALAIKKKNQDECLLCIVGDLIDFKENITLDGVNMLIYFLQYFGNICDIVIISGQHDTNIKNINDIDLIECCYNKLDIKYNIYYFKESGLYKMNNLILYVISVFDRKIIDLTKIKKRKELIIGMHHGLVISNKTDIEKLPYILKPDTFFREEVFNDCDITLLGDIHEHKFISPTIAYSSSFVQKNYGEPLKGHGYIKWNLDELKGTFNEVVNDYGLAVLSYKNNIKDKNMQKLPKNVSFKIKLDNTNKIFIEDEIDKLAKKHNIIGRIKYEEKITKFDIISIGGTKIDKFDMTDNKLITLLISEFCKKYYDISKDSKKMEDILKMHELFSQKVTIKSRTNKIIKFIKLEFSNIYTYGSNNIFIFNNEELNTVITGENGFGKSSILDIICYVLFDRSPRYGCVKYNVLNTVSKTGYVILNLTIDGNDYRIKKTINIDKRENYNHTCEVKRNNKIINTFDKKTTETLICDLLGLEYEEFIFLCLMPKNSKDEFLDKTNMERKLLISRLLNIDYFEEISEIVKKEHDIRTSLFEKNKKKYEDILKNYDSNLKLNDDEYDCLLNDSQDKMKKISNLKQQIEILKKEIKYVDANENEEEIKKEICEYKKIIIEKNKQIKKINLEIDENNTRHSDIIIPDEIKLNIKTYFKENNSNKNNLNEILYELIKINIDIVKTIHESDKKLLNDVNIIEKYIKDIENKINLCNNRMIECKKYSNILKNNTNIQKQINDKIKTIKELEISLNETMYKIYEMDDIKSKYISHDEFECAKNKYEKDKDNYDILNIYHNIINKNALPTSIFKIACEHIQKLANVFLEKIGIQYTTSLEINTKTKNQSILTEIEIYKYFKRQKVESMGVSTSERFILNLAYKLAMLNFFNISIPKFIIIDEKFEEIDKHKLKSLDDIFSVLHETYNDVFIISHLDQVVQYCDKHIIITRENEFSNIC